MTEKYKLNWTGEDAVDEVVAKLTKGFGRFALRVESNSKQELKYEHGVLTGTLRRSIHAASPDYNFAGDDVKPSSSSPELGGRLIQAMKQIKGIVIAVGSGLVYAMAVHQGHHSFEGYHYITNGLEKSRSFLKKDIEASM